MMRHENNFLYLIWKHPETRRNYTIGKLSKQDGFKFEYCDDATKAESAGWRLLNAFPAYQVYSSEKMFPVFASRLPDRKRRDIKNILQKYKLTEFDEFELLRKSGARLPIDTYEFVDPIFAEDEIVEREFYVMGIRHHSECKGVKCADLPKVNVGDYLFLEEEPDNAEDPLAIRVLTDRNEHLGYVPRYYNQAVLERMHNGITYSCEATEVNASLQCSECIKVKLNMPSVK